jgi:hypothetical protein
VGLRRAAALALVCAAGALSLAAVPAHAGSYEVVACDARVAGGAAPSWQVAANPPFSPQFRCPANLSNTNTGMVSVVPATAPDNAGFLANGAFDFVAPQGARLGSVTADVAISRPGAEHWTSGFVAFQSFALQPQLLPYGCYANQGPCTIPAGYRRVTVNLGGLAGARFYVGCGNGNGCPSEPGAARISVANAHMTVLDDSRPSLSVGGPLWVDGPHVRTDPAVVDATDNVGIRSLSILVDGVEKAVSPSTCDSTQRIPCPDVNDGAISLTGADFPDGLHTITVRTTDSAGNTSDASRSIQIFSPPATRLSARAAGRRGRAAKRVRVSVRRSVLVRGQLTLAAGGNPLAGQPIEVFATELRTAAPHVKIASVQTDANGRFSFRIPPGPARLVRFSFPGTSSAGPSASSVSLRVPASSTIHATPRRARLGQRVAIGGRLRLAGAPNPRPGKLVILQAFERGHWHTVATTRSRPSGTWRRAIRFQRRPGVYRLRVLIRRERSFPFVTGASRAVRVTIRP